MRITAPQEFIYPSGDKGIRIAAGPGMLRRIRKLVAAHGCPVDAVSRRGKVIAHGDPPLKWRPNGLYYMTWGGLGLRIPCRSSFVRPRSWAHASTSWKKESALRRKRAREHLQRPPTLPERLDSMVAKKVSLPPLPVLSDGDVAGDGIGAVADAVLGHIVGSAEGT